MHTPALCCKHLFNSTESPFRAYHISSSPFLWQVACTAQHQESDWHETTWERLTEQFPELAELNSIPSEMNVMMQRGIDSGKWYDFHLDAQNGE